MTHKELNLSKLGQGWVANTVALLRMNQEPHGMFSDIARFTTLYHCVLRHLCSADSCSPCRLSNPIYVSYFRGSLSSNVRNRRIDYFMWNNVLLLGSQPSTLLIMTFFICCDIRGFQLPTSRHLKYKNSCYDLNIILYVRIVIWYRHSLVRLKLS
jgi:hypothetical protein